MVFLSILIFSVVLIIISCYVYMLKYRFHYRLTEKKGIKSKSSQKLKDNNVHVVLFSIFSLPLLTSNNTTTTTSNIYLVYSAKTSTHTHRHTQKYTQHQLQKILYTPICLNDEYFRCVLSKVRLCVVILPCLYTEKGRQSSEEAVFTVCVSLAAVVQRVMYTYFALNSLKP